MARFIQNGNLLINTDFVKAVEKYDEKNIRIIMKDDSIIFLPKEMLSKISGEDVIRQVVPIRNVYAIFKKNGEYIREPVPAFAVTESGVLRPIDLDSDYPSFLDSFLDYEGTDYSQMTIEKGKHFNEEICD